MQALATPIVNHTVTKQRTTKKGKVITEETTFTITGAHIVGLALGKALMELFIVSKGLPGEVVDALRDAFTGKSRPFTGGPEADRFQALVDSGMSEVEALKVIMYG